MAVNELLAALAAIPDVVPGPVVNQIWRLAEGSGDVSLMRVLASRTEALPPAVVERLRLRKETEVRIAYLSRSDISDAERAELLAAEKRSDVFAGLIEAAKGNEALAGRLSAQFAARPTKVLARQILRDDFGDAALHFECLKVLVGDRQMPDWLERKLERIVRGCSSDKERAATLVPLLPIPMLLSLQIGVLDEDQQLELIGRLAAFGSGGHDRSDWSRRRLLANISEYLVEASALSGLSDRVVTALDSLSSASWVYDGGRIAGALAGRRAMMGDSVDERLLVARAATGRKLDDLVKLALVECAKHSTRAESLVQGLLENPAVLGHAGFRELVEGAPPACLVKAMQSTRSHDLMSLLWGISEDRIPEACWEYVDDPMALTERLLAETVARTEHPYRMSGLVSILLARGVSDAAVARLPLPVLVERGYHWRTSSQVLESAAPQVVRLQIESLGENPLHWENFNVLANGWTGTLGELLAASKNL